MSKVTQPKTMYSDLDTGKLRAMFDEDVWFKLDEAQKRDLLQETVNREVEANGSGYTCKVVFADLEPHVSGEQSGNTITLNREMFVNNMQTVDYGNRTVTHLMRDANIRAYECLMHEHQHALQNAIVEGKAVAASSKQEALFSANGYTVSFVDGKQGCHYMQGETSYSMYLLNPTEADAYRVSEAKTAALVSELNEKCGEVKVSNLIYTETMKEEAYDVRLQAIKEEFNNPNVEKEVANVLRNAYYDTDIPVDKNIETAVHKEMSATLTAILKENSTEVSKMNNDNNKWADMHVDRETFNNTLRDSVNAYYEHAMNDPSVSNEEAIAETAQVAEAYHNEMDAFDAAQAEAAASAEVSAGAVDTGSAGAGVSGGIDGGVDGGMGVE